MIFLEILKSLLFGIVEGITEWLPVSSTGHLILLEEFVKFYGVSEGFFEMFEVVVQLGAIIAVAVIFWKKIWPFKKGGEVLRVISQKKLSMWLKIAVACLPAAIVGVLLDDFIDALFYNGWTVGIMLVLVGVAFIIVEKLNKGRAFAVTDIDSLDYKRALGIGAFQLLAAIFPGTSRSGATILGGLMLGVDRTTAAEFTFFLGIPVMFGASLLKIVKFALNLIKNDLEFAAIEAVILIVGMVTAFAVSMVCIRFLMEFIKKHDFCVFGWYRIALGVIVLAYFAAQKWIF